VCRGVAAAEDDDFLVLAEVVGCVRDAEGLPLERDGVADDRSRMAGLDPGLEAFECDVAGRGRRETITICDHTRSPAATTGGRVSSPLTGEPGATGSRPIVVDGFESAVRTRRSVRSIGEQSSGTR